MQVNQHKLEQNINNIVSNQKLLFNKLDDITDRMTEIANQNLTAVLDSDNTEVLESNKRILTDITDIARNVQNLMSDTDAIDQKINEVKVHTAPKLYCRNQTSLDVCMEQHFDALETSVKTMEWKLSTIRLVNGSNKYEGRVEFNYMGRTGTVCDDGWDNNDAQVVCRMLGYSGGTALLSQNRFMNVYTFGRGTGEILLDNVECTGTEDSLFECMHGGIGVHNCDHAEDAGVRCST